MFAQPVARLLRQRRPRDALVRAARQSRSQTDIESSLRAGKCSEREGGNEQFCRRGRVALEGGIEFRLESRASTSSLSRPPLPWRGLVWTTSQKLRRQADLTETITTFSGTVPAALATAYLNEVLTV